MEKLIWSRFNFLIESQNKAKYLYNSYTNSLLRLETELFDELKKVAAQKVVTDIDAGFSEEEKNYFIENYILVENDDTLVELMHHQSLTRLYSRKHLALTIAPTQSCNFGCIYCYEKWRQSGSMSDQTEDALIEYLKREKEKNGLESISLTWYGGEPLLESKRIESLGKRINELGFEIQENEIITNGYFFTKEKIEILAAVGVRSIQITLDGIKEIHDTRRPLLNGKGTFDKIIQNLDGYFESEYKDHFIVAIRVNIDKNNCNDFLNLYNWLKERYRSDKLIVYPGWIYLDETSKTVSKCFNRNEATDFNLDLYKRYHILSEKMFPDDINMECMARSPYSMLIGWQGEIYKCFEDLGNKNLIVGNINHPQIFSNYDLIAKYAVGIDHYQDAECRKCSYLPICHGGCPIRRFENKYKNKNNDCCTPFKGRIEDYIEIYSALQEI